MIVRCGQCGTEFGLDARQIGDEGMAVRCSVCKNVFRVETSPPKPVPWQVETTDGTKFSAPSLNTLREWIEEGRLHPHDKVSRTGRSWVRLGDMPEFAAAFEGFVDLPPVVKPVSPVRIEVGSSVRPIAREPAPKVPPISRRPDAMPPTPVRGTTAPELDLEDEATKLHPVIRPEAGAAAVTPAPTPDDEDLTRQMYRPSVPVPNMASPAIERPSIAPRVEPAPARVAPVAIESSDEFEVAPRRRGISPGLVAFLGVIAAVGIMFGVPSIRQKLLGLGASEAPKDSTPPPSAADVPEIAAAEAATNHLGLAELAQAEAGLQRRLDAGEADPATSAAIEVALADLLLSRAIAYHIAAALDEAQREVYAKRARDDQDHGARLVDSLEGAPDVDRLGEVRALARLAAGRDPVEVLPLVPDSAKQTQWIVRAAGLWRDDSAAVPEGLVAGLQGIEPRSGLADATLALALVRANDETGARNLLERLLVRADDQIVGVALRVRLGGPSSAETGDESGDENDDATGETETGGDPGIVAKAPPVPVPTPDKPSSGGGGGSFDKLVVRGCEAARSGSADEGVTLLLRAFDDRPNDLDVLACLGDAYARQGQNRRAAEFYDRALDRSAKYKPALIGAAKVAAKTGATAKATKYYETLLSVDPDNADAKAFLAKQAADEGGGADSPPAEPSEGG